jgi:hypothetical protein
VRALFYGFGMGCAVGIGGFVGMAAASWSEPSFISPPTFVAMAIGYIVGGIGAGMLREAIRPTPPWPDPRFGPYARQVNMNAPYPQFTDESNRPRY